jgi:hypothetical protein
MGQADRPEFSALGWDSSFKMEYAIELEQQPTPLHSLVHLYLRVCRVFTASTLRNYAIFSPAMEVVPEI